MMPKYKEIGYNSYKDYLDGSHWKDLKNRYQKSKLLKVCRVCGTNKQLVLHHRTYNFLGQEHISIHVHLVCRRCHELIHYNPETKEKTPLTWKALTMRQTYLRKLFKQERKRNQKELRSNHSGSSS